MSMSQINVFTPIKSSVFTIDTKEVFYYFFLKNAFFNVLIFERFLFSSGKIFNSTKTAKLLHKTIFKWWS